MTNQRRFLARSLRTLVSVDVSKTLNRGAKIEIIDGIMTDKQQREL